MGWFSSFFSKSNQATKKPEVTPEQYKDFLIYPESMSEGGQYRVAGRITKQCDDQILEHKFIRSDVLGSQADANTLMLQKAKVFIDQSGDKIFNN